jgi:ribonuclease HI
MAEIAAMQLVLGKLWSHQALPNCRKCTGSQTAIKAIERSQRQSKQSIIKDLLDYIDAATDKYTHLQIDIVWIPGHSKTQGNERADA